MKRAIPISIVLALAVLSSCATYRQTIELRPLSLELPASASQSLRLGGATIAQDGFTVKKEFAFTKVVPVPLLSTGAVALELKPELDAIVLESGSNAIVELRIRLIGIDGRAARGVQATRCIGAIIGAIGSGISIYAYGFSGWDEPAISAIGLSAAGFGLAGGAAFGASFILERSASVEYTYEIRGKAVKIIN